MRPIKFRAWDKKNKRWMTPEIEDNEESELRLDIWGNLYFREPWFEQESGALVIVSGEGIFDLSQYTGLKDNNDTEIFEGDIVKRTHLFDGGYGETHTGEVVYDKDYARYVISRPQKYIEPKTEDLRNTLSDRSTYEVIGNIWENPELLEEEE